MLRLYGVAVLAPVEWGVMDCPKSEWWEAHCFHSGHDAGFGPGFCVSREQRDQGYLPVGTRGRDPEREVGRHWGQVCYVNEFS